MANGQSAVSGTNGKAVVAGTLVTRLTSWQLNDQCSKSEWGDSDSAGFTNTKRARRGASGTIGGKYDSNRKPHSIFKAGDDAITLALWVTNAASDYWAFPSVTIESFALEVNPDTKEVIGWTANWSSDGVYYAPGESGAPNYTLPAS